MSRGLKFRINEVEGLYYPYSENKGADQLRGYREADLRLCFRICKKPVFSRRGSYSMITEGYYFSVLHETIMLKVPCSVGTAMSRQRRKLAQITFLHSLT